MTRPPGAPPLPRVAVRVGVTGHRPEKLANAQLWRLRRRVRSVLHRVREVAEEVRANPSAGYRDAPPLLRVVSSLAEGADRIVAHEAMALGYELQCPLPFAREVYAEDFAPGPNGSREDYERLLGMPTTTILELDGSRRTPHDTNAAYERAGRTMVAQCDALIAIWNGRRASGRGGTGQIVALARSLEIPLVWIYADAPHRFRLLTRSGRVRGTGRQILDELARRLRQQLLPADQHTPAADGAPKVPRAGGQERHGADDWQNGPHRLYRDVYFGTRRRWVHPPVFRWFRQVLAHAPPGDTAPTGGWDESDAPPATAPGRTATAPPVPSPFDVDYSWADMLATYYGDLYRSSFITNYLLSALAVLFALIGFRWHRVVWVELALIGTILGLTRLGRLRGWHEQWLGYRLLAEELRQMMLLRPLGRVTPSFRVPIHSADADPGKWWVSWLFRARVREAGMVGARLGEPGYLESYRAHLLAQLELQTSYHGLTERIYHTLHRRLHSFGTMLFGATFLMCMLHLGLDPVIERLRLSETAVTHVAAFGNSLLTLFAAFLPALGAAFAGIESQGELSRIARRSAAMHEWLAALVQALRAADPPTSDVCSRIAEEAAVGMSGELLDWQVIFRGKPLGLPS